MRIMMLVAACILYFTGTAQFYYYNQKYYDQPIVLEAGWFGGYINCLTDLGGTTGPGKGFIKDLNPEAGNFNTGIFAAVNVRRKYSIRLNILHGKIGAADSLINSQEKEAVLRYNRNLHFLSPLTEVSIITEIYFLQLLGISKKENLLLPYLSIGIGIFKFSPKAYLNGQLYHLHEYHTEGQGSLNFPERKPYKLLQANIPAGAGIRYEVNARWNLRAEVLHRKLFTDYLDDVSTRYIHPNSFYSFLNEEKAVVAVQLADRRLNKQQPSQGQIRGGKGNDSYFHINLLLSYTINRKSIVR